MCEPEATRAGKSEHKPPIGEDLTKLYESTAFGLNDPEKLQTKYFFQVMLCLCNFRWFDGPNCPVVSFELNPLNEFLFLKLATKSNCKEMFKGNHRPI